VDYRRDSNSHPSHLVLNAPSCNKGEIVTDAILELAKRGAEEPWADRARNLDDGKKGCCHDP